MVHTADERLQELVETSERELHLALDTCSAQDEHTRVGSLARDG